MKTETLLHFQYQNAATTYLVKATEYDGVKGPIWRLTTIDGNIHRTISPESRAQATLLAESAVKAFLARMHIIYNAD